MHHPRYKSPAGFLIPGILCAREEGGSHSQNKLKDNSSPLWFVGLWCVLADQMLLIHGTDMSSRGTGEIHIKNPLYSLGDNRYYIQLKKFSELKRKRGQQKASITHLLGFNL